MSVATSFSMSSLCDMAIESPEKPRSEKRQSLTTSWNAATCHGSCSLTPNCSSAVSTSLKSPKHSHGASDCARRNLNRWFAAYALGSNDSVSHINNVYFGSNKVTSANISIVVSVGNTILYLDAVMIFCRCVRIFRVAGRSYRIGLGCCARSFCAQASRTYELFMHLSLGKLCKHIILCQAMAPSIGHAVGCCWVVCNAIWPQEFEADPAY
ncbi:uncharacterized protein LOC120645901 [Panicum virgatum]|uniref:uncharacterized protein LOC120645901 n=1 Tax=Panicum virgatum TaxID=38727 RepID=UPI0019D5940C|nr:uncharacterized protein LOC120645901 [Panicum virgatum]